MVAVDVPILLVEDDIVDCEAVRRALSKASISNPLYNACDGVEALELLKGINGHEKLDQPCLILLDLNMPRMNGFQFLDELRRDEGLKQNAVFVLTTSFRQEDKNFARNMDVAGYILKDHLNSLAEILNNYCNTHNFTPDHRIH